MTDMEIEMSILQIAIAIKVLIADIQAAHPQEYDLLIQKLWGAKDELTVARLELFNIAHKNEKEGN